MPKYLNNLAQPVYFNNTVFPPNQEVETYDTLENQAFAVGSIAETFNIAAGNKVLKIKFNEETVWTTVTLTEGGAQTAADIILDINTAYGRVVASDEGGKVRIDAPRVNNILNSIYIATVGSTAAATLGLSTNAVNPVSCVSLQAFKISANAETYNIDSTNNIFIFKVNNGSWITATLTVGATQTAAEIVSDINSAYETATADANKIAFAVIPITIGGAVHIKLRAPVYNNFQSKLYIKLTNNTALTVLGFIGDNNKPAAKSLFPSLIKTSELPLYNPIFNETTLVFSAASTQHYYLIDPDNCKELQISRVSGVAGITFTIYLQDILNVNPFTLVGLEIISIDLTNVRITKLIIISSDAGSLAVREVLGTDSKL